MSSAGGGSRPSLHLSISTFIPVVSCAGSSISVSFRLNGQNSSGSSSWAGKNTIARILRRICRTTDSPPGQNGHSRVASQKRPNDAGCMPSPPPSPHPSYSSYLVVVGIQLAVNSFRSRMLPPRRVDRKNRVTRASLLHFNISRICYRIDLAGFDSKPSEMPGQSIVYLDDRVRVDFQLAGKLEETREHSVREQVAAGR